MGRPLRGLLGNNDGHGTQKRSAPEGAGHGTGGRPSGGKEENDEEAGVSQRAGWAKVPPGTPESRRALVLCPALSPFGAGHRITP